MGDLEWTNDLVIRLMEEYKNRPELWNPTHEMYRVHTIKYESYRELASMFQCDIADLRKKLNSLFASHRREKAKIRAGGTSLWFLYPYMSFLPNHLDCDSPATTRKVRGTIPKTRPPVKEAAAPPTDSDDDEEPAMEEEHLEEEEEVVIKVEPVHVQPQEKSFRRHAVHHKPRLTRLTRPIKKRVIKQDSFSSTDARLAEAVRLLRRTDLARKKDECDSFGEYIADSLRKHDDRTQSMIKQAINNILFEQEMKKYNNQYTVMISGIDENPLILDGSDK